LILVCLALALSAVGCPCIRGAINDSPSLRWWLFSNFGASKVCPEMLKRGVPLKLQALGNESVGRFFPQTCHVSVNDQTKTMTMSASGTGYASVPLVRRVGFYCAVQVEMTPDFRLESDSIYVWGRYSRMITAPDLRIAGAENGMVSLATATPVGDMASLLGQLIVTSEIARGFTVVRQDDGDDFTLGILNPPEKPKRQFKAGADHTVLASDLAQVAASAREYLGPFEVPGSGKALFLKTKIAGAPLLYTIVDRATGDAWRRSYESGAPMGPPPGQPLYGDTLGVGEASLRLPLREGQYYIVFENRSPPPTAPLGMPLPFPENVAHLVYGVELGDK
jgi:hypothetical protein